MSLYQRPPRSDELYHWGKGNHKYIQKIGNRYFYTMEELKAFKDGATHSFDKSRQVAINKIGGARDRVARALARRRVTNPERMIPVRSQQADRARSTSDREQSFHEYRAAQEKKKRNEQTRNNNNNARLLKEDSRSQQRGQRSTIGNIAERNARQAGRNLRDTANDARNAVKSGYENDVKKPITRVAKNVSSNARQAGRNLRDTANNARNIVVSDTKKTVKSGREYVESKRSALSNNTKQAGNNLRDTINSARNAVKTGYDNDIKKPVKKVSNNSKQAGKNLVDTITSARDAIVKGYDEDIRKRRRRR